MGWEDLVMEEDWVMGILWDSIARMVMVTHMEGMEDMDTLGMDSMVEFE